MNTNTPTEFPDYPTRILEIKLWEWEGIAEKWDQEMTKHGPCQEVAELYNTATDKVKELKSAIAKLKSPNPITTTP
jgi:hypothetical protein